MVEPLSNLPFLFFISGVLRLVVSAALVGGLEERRHVERLACRHRFRELPLLKPLVEFSWRRPAE